ncbi:hypothetical protein LP417_29155 [Polaromonas sp. P1-6]|nr:hypothetical protein LP417_29155 [Polaromonas sp. P1-6]
MADPHDLQRFALAQNPVYRQVCVEAEEGLTLNAVHPPEAGMERCGQLTRESAVTGSSTRCLGPCRARAAP